MRFQQSTHLRGPKAESELDFGSPFRFCCHDARIPVRPWPCHMPHHMWSAEGSSYVHHAGLMRHPHGPYLGTQNTSPADVKEPAASSRDPRSPAPGTSGDTAAAAPASSSSSRGHKRLVTVLVGRMFDCFSGVMSHTASIYLLPLHSRTQRPGARLTCAATCTTLSDEQQTLTCLSHCVQGPLSEASLRRLSRSSPSLSVCVCAPACQVIRRQFSALFEIAAALPPARPLVLFGGYSASAHTLRSLARHVSRCSTLLLFGWRADVRDEGGARDVELQHMQLITGQLVSNPDGTIVGAMKVPSMPPRGSAESRSGRHGDSGSETVEGQQVVQRDM